MIAVMHQQEILASVVSFLTGREVVTTECVSRQLRDNLSDDKIWELQCRRLGWKQISTTRTRGRRLWKDVYMSNICSECRSEGASGTVIFDTGGGSKLRVGLVATSLVALCSECVFPVQQLYRFSDRKKYLPRLRKRLEFTWSRLLSIIPHIPSSSSDHKSKKGAPTTKVLPGQEGAESNDHLIRGLRKYRPHRPPPLPRRRKIV